MISTSAVSREECCKVIKKHLQRDNFELKSYSISSIGSEVKGFMGDHLKLHILVSLREGDSQDSETTELQFFIKSVPVDDSYRRTFALSGVAYKKEVLFYGDLLCDVQKYLLSPEYQSSTYLGTVPFCYYLRPDLLVLEDLALAGFRLLDVMETLDLDRSECVLKALARFHAASLVFEERGGRRLADVYPQFLEESFYRKESDFCLYKSQIGSRRAAHVLLDLIPRFAPGTTHNEELHRLLSPALEEVYDQLKPGDKYRKVLCHRDLWVNNILFAENSKGELSVRLVDFQTLHMEPPAHDVLLFLHLSTARDLRKAHGRRLLELYHQTLADVLRRHDLDVDSILPLQVFLQSCEDTKHVAATLAVYILEVVLLPLQQDDDMESFLLERSDLLKAAYQQDERFRSRMKDCMEEYVEICLLPRLTGQQK